MIASACLTRAGRFWLAAAIRFLLVLETRAAQSSFRADPSFLIDTWETEDGLPENSATAMVQTSDGYLWFGTFNGLVRFRLERRLGGELRSHVCRTHSTAARCVR